jgi:SAM-dependent methyltransferase
MPVPTVNSLENTILGFAAPSQLALIEHWAKEIPKNGTVVEIGSFIGRSAWHWAKSVDPSVTVYAIDSWDHSLYNRYNSYEVKSKLRGNNQISDIDFSMSSFINNVNDCPNIIPVKARSPYVPTDILEKLTNVDCVYIDDSHVNPEFNINFNFWRTRVRPGGIFCGDDFHAVDVCTTVGRFSAKNRKQLYARGNFWRLYDWDESIDLND